jgi:hypothetical protein
MMRIIFRRWLDYFPKEQFLFIDGEGFITNPFKEVKKIEKFLNLKSFFTKEHFAFNSKKGFYCIIKDLNSKDKKRRCMGLSKGREHPFIAKDTLEKLNKFFKPLSIELFQMIKQKPFWNII